jgi:predicted house-cleaning noncanonical NTP pyrophosphatase (MazG superfamily)
MTAQSDFGGDEWTLIQEGPLTAGMIVLTAEGGGTIRETFALARAYADTRKQHGESELLDEIVSDSPKFDRHRYRSKEELREEGLQRLGDAVALLRAKATPEELGDYREFVLAVASKVATAHKEDGQEMSPSEQSALDEVRARMADA